MGVFEKGYIAQVFMMAFCLQSGGHMVLVVYQFLISILPVYSL